MPRLRAARASALLAAPAQSRLAGQPIGRGRLGGRRRILEAQRELVFEVLDPLGLLGHFSFPFGELTAQPLNLLLQPFLSVPLLPSRARTPHVSDGTPIASTCTDPLNCYQFGHDHFSYEEICAVGTNGPPDPSSCPQAVCQSTPQGGKSDPSRGRGTRADDHDDRGAPQDCADGAGARRGRRRAGPPDDTPVSNTRGRDRRTRRSRRDHCSDDTLSGEAACPRRRSGSPLRLDTARKPWHKRDDRIGPSEHRDGHPRVWRSKLQALTFNRRGCQLTRAARTGSTKRLWTLPQPWTHRTRPPLLGNLAEEREIPTSAHSHPLFFLKRRTKNPTTTKVQIYAVSGEC